MRRFLTAMVISFFCTVSAFAGEPVRTLKIVTSHDASVEVKDAAAAVASAVQSHSLLKVFAEGKPAEAVESEKLLQQPVADRAFSHLVVVGLLSDPMVKRTWQQEARPLSDGLYVFGFGFFTGDIGYIESDRNPFLHSEAIAAAPFETEIVTITGTTPAGVAAAVKAFLEKGLINGVIAGGKWTRLQAGLLDRDPLPKDFALPALLPDQIGKFIRVGVTQASEDEYRGVLQDTGVAPAEIWRAKYYVPGPWDGQGWRAAFIAYHTGLHRRATGNTLWVARFESADIAQQAAAKIAAAAELAADKDTVSDRYNGKQPPFDKNDSPGPLTLWRHGEWVIMSTLPKTETDRVLADLAKK